MKANDLSMGKRVFHENFGWCKIIHPFLAAVSEKSGKALIDTEADEITYYIMGHGYKTFKRDENGRNIVYVPIEELHPDENFEQTEKYLLGKIALNCQLTFWPKKGGKL